MLSLLGRMSTLWMKVAVWKQQWWSRARKRLLYWTGFSLLPICILFSKTLHPLLQLTRDPGSCLTWTRRPSWNRLNTHGHTMLHILKHHMVWCRIAETQRPRSASFDTMHTTSVSYTQDAQSPKLIGFSRATVYSAPYLRARLRSKSESWPRTSQTMTIWALATSQLGQNASRSHTTWTVTVEKGLILSVSDMDQIWITRNSCRAQDKFWGWHHLGERFWVKECDVLLRYLASIQWRKECHLLPKRPKCNTSANRLTPSQTSVFVCSADLQSNACFLHPNRRKDCIH